MKSFCSTNIHSEKIICLAVVTFHLQKAFNFRFGIYALEFVLVEEGKRKTGDAFQILLQHTCFMLHESLNNFFSILGNIHSTLVFEGVLYRLVLT